MEMRSQNFYKLRSLLRDAGIYEDGMGMAEMRELAQAMEKSVDSYHAEEDADLNRALQVESELDFLLPTYPNAMLNSTMIGTSAPTTEDRESLERECDSPPTQPIHITVEADVHHPYDWSPPSESSLTLKRLANEPVQQISNEVLAKRPLPEQQPNRNPDSLPTSPIADSGFTGEGMSSLSSISVGSTMPSIGEMPSRLLISTSSAVVSESSRSEIEDNNQ